MADPVDFESGKYMFHVIHQIVWNMFLYLKKKGDDFAAAPQ